MQILRTSPSHFHLEISHEAGARATAWSVRREGPLAVVLVIVVEDLVGITGLTRGAVVVEARVEVVEVFGVMDVAIAVVMGVHHTLVVVVEVRVVADVLDEVVVVEVVKVRVVVDVLDEVVVVGVVVDLVMVAVVVGAGM